MIANISNGSDCKIEDENYEGKGQEEDQKPAIYVHLPVNKHPPTS